MATKPPPFPRFISRRFLRTDRAIHMVVRTHVPYWVSGSQLVFWVVHRKPKGDWRWTLFARNGKVLGASSEGFMRRRACILNAGAHGCPLATLAVFPVTGMYVTNTREAWQWNLLPGINLLQPVARIF